MVTAIFQARLGSTRLQGKILRPLLGKPLIWHVLNRVKAAKMVDDIVVATTSSEKDIPLCSYLKELGVNIFIGNEKNVLDRFYQAAKFFKADVVVRITPDDPFKDSEVIDKAVHLFLNAPKDIDCVTNSSYNDLVVATYPEGLDIEVFSFHCLKKMWQKATDPFEQEHVTPYLYNNPEEFKILPFGCEEDLSHHRWTIDHEVDFQFAEKIYQRLYPNNNNFSMKDILALLKSDPELVTINAGFVRGENYRHV